MPAPDVDARRVWVFDGGPTPVEHPPDEAEPTFVIAADSGLHHADALGLVPDALVGDLDSVDPEALRRWQETGGHLQQHPPDKDFSDLELALRYVSSLRPQRVVVLSSGGGRLDHLLTSVLCIGHWAANHTGAGLQLLAYVDASLVLPLSQGNTYTFDGGRNNSFGLPLHLNTLFTLLPVGGPAAVSTKGLGWELTAADTLQPGTTRGLSNIAAASTVEITVHRGTVLAVLPKPSVASKSPS